jgi:hypothetical protein
MQNVKAKLKRETQFVIMLNASRARAFRFAPARQVVTLGLEAESRWDF